MTQQILTKPLESLDFGTVQAVINPSKEAGVVAGVLVDSRQAAPDFLFAALPGVNAHGAHYVGQVIAAGVKIVLTDPAGFEVVQTAGLETAATYVICDDARAALSHVAASFHAGQPAQMIAVTGTNGKTSVATFTRQIWQAMGLSAVNFGTTGVEGSVAAPLSHTTPEPVTLHRLLASLAAQGVTHAAMEASSHGLAQRRLDGVHLSAAGFTHLSRDHLDYHHTFEEYEAAKALLFNRVMRAGTAVINTDTDAGLRMAAIAQKRGLNVLGVGRRLDAQLHISDIDYGSDGQHVKFIYAGESYTTRLSLIGAFQADNVLLAAGLAIGAGADPKQVFATLDQLVTVPGRMQAAAILTTGAAVYVDYAHTPDSLATALQALRPHVSGQLHVVFGAGGDRDTGKRILMGQAAAAYADHVIVTDDNPRSEAPHAIRAAVLAGCPDADDIEGRRLAIETGIAGLAPGDVLLIAGKGHETGQTIAGVVHPFNDVDEARRAVAVIEGKI